MNGSSKHPYCDCEVRCTRCGEAMLDKGVHIVTEENFPGLLLAPGLTAHIYRCVECGVYNHHAPVWPGYGCTPAVALAERKRHAGLLAAWQAAHP